MDDTEGSSAGCNRYQRALDALAPLEPLLAGFARRNKNQHRRARWWASLGMLRRGGVGKLTVELAAAAVSKAAVRRRHGQACSTNSSTSTKKPASNNNNTTAAAMYREDDGQHLLDAADRRAEWARDVLVPKCYIQFSQLAADSQFATLGVVLLGALAQVHAACVMLAGPSPDEWHATRHVGRRLSDAIQGSGTNDARTGEPMGTVTGDQGSAHRNAGLVAAGQQQEAGGRKIARPAEDGGKVASWTLESRGGVRGGLISRMDAATPIAGISKTHHSMTRSDTETSLDEKHRQTSGDARHQMKNKQLPVKRKRDAVAATGSIISPGVVPEGCDGTVMKSSKTSDNETRMASRPAGTETAHVKKKLRKIEQDVAGEGADEQDKQTEDKKAKKMEKEGSKDDIASGAAGSKDTKRKKKKKTGGGEGRDEFDSLFSSLF
ncbi:ribonuclease MRP protein subunit RMP1 [Microdochium nivale]|nr:ribonuclease MRP protein subunit RMP1 [Microdochium nivale]